MPVWNTAAVVRGGRAGLACLGGFVLAILPASLAEAEYGPRTIIGANYQQTSTTQSEDRVTEGSCQGQFLCYILFQRVPEQKRLIVQHVSCVARVTDGGLFWARLQTRKGRAFPLKYTYLTPIRTSADLYGTAWLVNSPVMHLVESKEHPLVFLANTEATGWLEVECSISGQLKQP